MADGTHAAAFAGGDNSNFDTAIDIGNNAAPDHLALAGTGSNDIAIVEAPDSTATSGGDLLDPALTGNNDIALVLNPFGAGGDLANVGINGLVPGNFDFGAVLFDDNASSTAATGADYLYDVVTALGEQTNAAATLGAGWLADLLALF